MNRNRLSPLHLLVLWLLGVGTGVGQMVTLDCGAIPTQLSSAVFRPWYTIDWPWIETAVNEAVVARAFTVSDTPGHNLASGDSIDFGTTDIGGYKNQTFTITNTFLTSLTGLTCTLDGADAADFVLSAVTLPDLEMGTSTTLTVTYVPELVGKISAATLHLSSSYGTRYDFPLKATGGNLNPTVRVEEVGGAVVTTLSRPLDFGSPMIGQSTSKTFRITNTGTAPLREVSVARDDPWHYAWWTFMHGYITGLWRPDSTYQYESGFTVTGLGSSVIPPGESRTLTVTWRPYETAQKTRNITFSWAIREPPPPSPTFDLTSGGFGPLILSAATISIYNPIAPNTPPVRFSIPVTGAAVPYALAPAPLRGLHYHLGHDAPTVLGSPNIYHPIQPTNLWVYLDESGVPLPDTTRLISRAAPEAAALLPETQARWLGYPFPLSPSSANWRSTAQAALALSHTGFGVPLPADYPITTPPSLALASPLSAAVSGDGSAATSTDSHEAASFFKGGRLSQPNLKLPAAENVGMELWIKPRSREGTQCLAFMGTTSNTGGFGLWLMDGVPHGLVNGSEAATMVRSNSGPLAAHTWHHVAFIIQAAGAVGAPASDLLAERRTASLYLDGVLVGRAEAAGLPALVQGFAIGAMADGTLPYTGLVDELRLFEIPTSGFDPATQLLARAKPDTQLAPSNLDFSDTLPGSSTQTATLTNNGPGWLRITNMEVTGDGAADYQVTATTAQPLVPDPTAPPEYPANGLIAVDHIFGPYVYDGLSDPIVGQGTSLIYRSTLPPQHQLAVIITHTATTLGQRLATLRITTNDLAHPVYEIALNANTLAAPASAPKLRIQRIRINAGSWLYTNEESWDWGALLTNDERGCTFFVGNEGTAPLPSFGVEVIGPHAEDITLTGNGAIGASGAPIVDGRVEIPNGGQPFGHSAYVNLNLRPRAVGARYAALRITSADPERSEVIIPIYGRGVLALPEIAVAVADPSSLCAIPTADGGSASAGQAMLGGNHSLLNCYVYNIGTALLDGVSASIDGPDAADFAVVANNGPFSVQSGNGIEMIQIRFTPSRVGIHSATLHILSNDTDESPYDITLTATGLTPAPVMQVIERGNVSASGEGFIRFGTAVIGGSAATQTIHVRNTGTATLTDLGAQFTGPNASDFSISLPRPIAASAEGDIVITFTPQDIGPRSTVLTLNSNDTHTSPYRIALGGTGAYGAQSNLSPPAIPGWVGTALAELPNGSILMAGYVAAAEGAAGSRLRVIGKDGSERTPFVMEHMWVDGTVRSIAVQENGGVLIAGHFTRVWQQGRVNITAGPTLDTLSKDCKGVALILPDPSWLANVPNLTPVKKRVSLPVSPCAWSTAFTPPKGDFIGRAVVALPNGKVLVGGNGSLGGRANLIRLNADGSLDTTFTLPEPNGPVNALGLQDDGKVLVGGEFTNLGHDRLIGETPVTPTVPYPTTPRSGLCRLAADGTDDDSFANRGFRQVTALAVLGDRIAVGGMARRLAASNVVNVHGLWSGPSQPTVYVEYDQPIAQIVGLDGRVIVDQFLQNLPSTIALQPGNRMLVPVGYFGDYDHAPTVSLFHPSSSAPDWFGDKRSDGEGMFWPHTVKRQRLLGGQVNAIIAQADGKVLVAGGFTSAHVGQSQFGFQWDTSTPPLDTSPLPPDSPLAGFVQLDIDGFFKASPRVWYTGQPMDAIVPTTDGLATLFVPEEPQPDPGAISLGGPTHSTYIGVRQCSPSSIAIDGPDADAFTWDVEQDSLIHATVCAGDTRMWISFTPKHQGKHRAVLHVHEDGIENDFDIALEGMGEGSLPDQVRLVDAAGNNLQSTDARDFGSSASLNLRLFNDSPLPNSTPFELSITGADASDFIVSPTAINSIPGSTRNGAGFVPIVVTFKATAAGTRMATLNLITVNRGREGVTRSLPFTIHLTAGRDVQSPVFTSQPQDVLVMEGQPFSLSVGFTINAATDSSWHHQRGSSERMVKSTTNVGLRYPANASDVLLIAAAERSSAGIYRAKITPSVSDSSGSVNSQPAQVGVVSVVKREIKAGLGRIANLGVSFVGPPTMPGTSAAVYRWRFNGQFLDNAADISGAHGPSLSLYNLTLNRAGAYTCVVTMGTATLETPRITLDVVSVPLFLGYTGNIAWQLGVQVTMAVQVDAHVDSYTVTGLPPGVTFNRTTGVFGGRPTRSGNYNIFITATNAAGSGVTTLGVNVQPIPAAILGTYVGAIGRGPASDYLGGSFTLSLTATGAFTARVNMGSQEPVSSGGHIKGRVRSTKITGFLEGEPDGNVYRWHGPDTATKKSNNGLLQLTLETTSRSVYLFAGDEHGYAEDVGGGNHRQAGALLSGFTGSYSAVAEPDGQPKRPLEMKAIIGRDGWAVWVSNVRDEGRRIVFTGSTFITDTPAFALFGMQPLAKLGRSHTGTVILGPEPEGKVMIYGLLEYGNNVEAETNSSTGKYFWSRDVLGWKLR